jgi:hypothetical protein
MRVQEKDVMNFSVAKKSTKRICYSLKNNGETLLQVSGGGENEEEENICEKSPKKSKKREWEFQGDREEERV